MLSTFSSHCFGVRTVYNYGHWVSTVYCAVQRDYKKNAIVHLLTNRLTIDIWPCTSCANCNILYLPEFVILKIFFQASEGLLACVVWLWNSFKYYGWYNMCLSRWGQFHDYKLFGVFCTYSSSMAKGTVSVLLLVLKSSVRHVTGNDKDYLRKIPRVVW